MKICHTIIEILTFNKWSQKFTVSRSVISYLQSMELTDVSINAIVALAKQKQTSGPKFTILWGHVEEILLLNKFFSDCRYVP